MINIDKNLIRYRNKKQVQEYIKHQLDEDQIADQMSIKEYIDPFTGSENKKA